MAESDTPAPPPPPAEASRMPVPDTAGNTSGEGIGSEGANLEQPDPAVVAEGHRAADDIEDRTAGGEDPGKTIKDLADGDIPSDKSPDTGRFMNEDEWQKYREDINGEKSKSIRQRVQEKRLEWKDNRAEKAQQKANDTKADLDAAVAGGFAPDRIEKLQSKADKAKAKAILKDAKAEAYAVKTGQKEAQDATETVEPTPYSGESSEPSDEATTSSPDAVEPPEATSTEATTDTESSTETTEPEDIDTTETDTEAAEDPEKDTTEAEEKTEDEDTEEPESEDKDKDTEPEEDKDAEEKDTETEDEKDDKDEDEKDEDKEGNKDKETTATEQQLKDAVEVGRLLAKLGATDEVSQELGDLIAKNPEVAGELKDRLTQAKEIVDAWTADAEAKGIPFDKDLLAQAALKGQLDKFYEGMTEEDAKAAEAAAEEPPSDDDTEEKTELRRRGLLMKILKALLMGLGYAATGVAFGGIKATKDMGAQALHQAGKQG